jgi:hypothetical protein
MGSSRLNTLALAAWFCVVFWLLVFTIVAKATSNTDTPCPVDRPHMIDIDPAPMPVYRPEKLYCPTGDTRSCLWLPAEIVEGPRRPQRFCLSQEDLDRARRR